MCGFVTPLQGPEADEHRKPEVAEPRDLPPACLLPASLPSPAPPKGCLRERGRRGWPRRGLGGVGSVPAVSRSPLLGPPQAVVLEGNYWKRRIEVVMREYHKWRIYYKKRVSGGGRGSGGLRTTASLGRARARLPSTPPDPASH